MFQIFTDNGSNLPLSLTKENEIGIIPLHYSLSGEEFACTDASTGEFDGARYYQRMRNGEQGMTSMVNIAQFDDAFRRVLEAGKDVLFVSMSSGISGTYDAARLVAKELREEFPKRVIALVDTKAASLGEGIPVLHAARLRRQGCTVQEAASAAAAESRRICQYFTVGDPKYLLRGGRLRAIAQKANALLNIRPILRGNNEGKIVLCGGARGGAKAMRALAKYYEALCCDAKALIGIAHADAGEAAENLAEMLKQRGHTGEILRVCYEPVTGTHVGPDTVALFFPGFHR